MHVEQVADQRLRRVQPQRRRHGRRHRLAERALERRVVGQALEPRAPRLQILRRRERLDRPQLLARRALPPRLRRQRVVLGLPLRRLRLLRLELLLVGRRLVGALVRLRRALAQFAVGAERRAGRRRVDVVGHRDLRGRRRRRRSLLRLHRHRRRFGLRRWRRRRRRFFRWRRRRFFGARSVVHLHGSSNCRATKAEDPTMTTSVADSWPRLRPATSRRRRASRASTEADRQQRVSRRRPF